MGRIISRAVDLSDKTYGRLKVLKRVGTKHECALWLCRCYCGTHTEVSSLQLNRTRKPTRSCGNCNDHEKYHTEWLAWRNMQERCYNINNKDYTNYGARGITVADFFRADFFNFFEEVGFKPTPAHTLDRVNNEANYEPGNVRWATRHEQNNNKRNVHLHIKEILNRVNTNNS